MRQSYKWLFAICMTVFGVAILFYSCKEQELEDVFYDQILYVNFVNAEGESLVADMECDEEVELYSADPTRPDKLNAISTKYYRVVSTDPSTLTNFNQLGYVWISGTAYLDLCFTMLNRETSTFTCDIRCEHLFGDDKGHRLVAEYKTISKCYLECVALSIDGVTYDVDPGGFVTVRIDRE